MSDLRETTLDLEVIGDYGTALKSGILVTAYADESGTVSKVMIHSDEVLKLAIYIATHAGEIISEQVKRQGEQIRDIQNLLAK
jgi:hypothetical protein